MNLERDTCDVNCQPLQLFLLAISTLLWRRSFSIPMILGAMLSRASHRKLTTRQFTSPGVASLGQAPGGRIFAHGNEQLGNSFRLTTQGRVQKLLVPCDLGGGHGQGHCPKSQTMILAMGTGDVTSLGGLQS